MEYMNNIGDGMNDENGLSSMMERGRGSGEEGGGCGGGGNGDVVNLKKGPWTTAEDVILIDYVSKHGEGNWNAIQRNTSLNRCGKSCRLRWANHLRPNLKKGAFSPDEEKLIIEYHAQFGNKWARMAALLPGRTDNEIKNYWNTRIKRRQRQGLPLYSDGHDISNTTTIPSPRATPNGSNPNNITTNFKFFNQNHHQYQRQQQQQHHHLPPMTPTSTNHYSPLSSPLQHRQQHQYQQQQQQQQHSYSPHTFLDTSPAPLSSSSPSPLSFTFQKPPPHLSPPLRFKRYRSTPNFSLQAPNSMTQSWSSSHLEPSLTSHQDSNFGFPLQYNSSFSQYIHTPLLESDLGVSSSSSSLPFSTKLELPSNQYSRLSSEQDIMANNNIEFNNDHNSLFFRGAMDIEEFGNFENPS